MILPEPDPATHRLALPVALENRRGEAVASEVEQGDVGHRPFDRFVPRLVFAKCVVLDAENARLGVPV